MKYVSHISGKFTCRLLQRNDYPQIIELMHKLKIPVAGLYSKAIYTAIYRRALTDKRIVFVVVELQSKLIGLVIALIDRNSFWISFLLRHPLFAIQILFRKLFRFMEVGVTEIVPDPAHLEDINKYLTTSISDRSWWKDSSPQIAKALFLSIDPEYRKSGIGFLLNQYRDKVLVERGVKRYDGIVEIHRIPQIHLLHKAGFSIEKRGDRFFVSKIYNGGNIR
jgi:ribosomal protein S18 acetylase RimI-like enzyme